MLIGSSQVSPLIRDLFESSCLNYLQGIEYDYKKVKTVDELSDTLTSQISAHSSDLNIELFLRAPKKLLSLLLPIAEITSLDKDLVLGDWIMELSNQLLGRLKNDLISHDYRLDMGIPKLYPNTVLTRSGWAEEACHRWLYEVENSAVECYLVIKVFNDNLTMRGTKIKRKVIGPGALELF